MLNIVIDKPYYYKAFQHFFESHRKSVRRLCSKKSIGRRVLQQQYKENVLFSCNLGDRVTAVFYKSV